MAVTTRLRHVLESQQFTRPVLDEIFTRAGEMRADPHRAGGRLNGRIMAALFYEPSTRTRLSFESAMLRLGGRTMGTDNAREFSSAAKGETLEDTIRIVAGYADAIVLRHPEEGAAARAAAVSDVPIVNAGDGRGQHPTQALLDVYTIRDELGRLDGVRVAMVGDLANGRTARSLAYLLSRYRDVQITFVAPPEVAMGADIKTHLDEHGVHWSETTDLEPVLATADVVYQTRIQKERFADAAAYGAVRGRYVIGPAEMARLGADAIVMHPLPRVGEIDPAIDGDPRAAYFRQARNGVHIRMALLDMLLS
ncbi:MAG: aspartate carbamoyltransferase [Candidatus Dormibacteraeota bacterium]|nr:aspartate carbamoyltransferase [Candidatus Dormibacteraeota bacterium]